VIDHTVKTPTLIIEIAGSEPISFIKGTWFEGISDRGEQYRRIKGPNDRADGDDYIVAVFLQEKQRASAFHSHMNSLHTMHTFDKSNS
jgi:hypothetical protein